MGYTACDRAAAVRIAFLTCHLPYPPLSGGRRREHELLRRVADQFDLELCVVTKTLAADREALPDVPWRHDGIQLFEAEPIGAQAPQVARHGSAAASSWLARN